MSNAATMNMTMCGRGAAGPERNVRGGAVGQPNVCLGLLVVTSVDIIIIITTSWSVFRDGCLLDAYTVGIYIWATFDVSNIDLHEKHQVSSKSTRKMVRTATG